MIEVIQNLHRQKEVYKTETMHLAGNIADRYLSYLTFQNDKAPNLHTLAATSLLIAAKIEQPLKPSFELMIELLPELQRKRTSKRDLIDLEEKIVIALDFDFTYASPLTFLERY